MKLNIKVNFNIDYNQNNLFKMESRYLIRHIDKGAGRNDKCSDFCLFPSALSHRRPPLVQQPEREGKGSAKV